MAWSIRILSAERRAEGVDSTQGGSSQLALQLTRNGQRGLLTKEVVVIDNLTLLVLLQVVEVLGSYLEHVACTLTVAGGNQRGVEVEETVLVEIGMDGHRHIVTDAHHSTKGVGTQAHMGILTHSLERLALLLHGVVVAAETIDLQLGGLDLTGLTSTLALYQHALGIDAGTCGDVLQQLLVKLGGVNDNLYVLDGRTIVQRDEVDSLRTAMRAHPTLYANFLAIFCALQHINNLCSLHNLIVL